MIGPAPQPHDALASILQKLDDEVFFAILDVALDIENELIIGTQPLFINIRRSGLTDRRLGEDLIIDIAHYKQRQDCKALVCFVYDPDHRLTNPHGIENDLSELTDGFDVRVLIRPES